MARSASSSQLDGLGQHCEPLSEQRAATRCSPRNLGAAHLARNKEQYQKSTDDTAFREFGMEMLAGDPFMTLSP